MDTIAVKWSGPHKLDQVTPWEEGGAIGLYIVIQDHDDIVYVGKASAKKGAVARARSHRKKYARRRRMRGLDYDINKAVVYAGHVASKDEGLIALAEHLLISHLYRTHGHQMVNAQKLYYGWKPPLKIINEVETSGKMPGRIPPCLSKKIISPSELSGLD